MKTLLKLIALAVPLLAITPTFAGVRFGVDIHVGPPAPPHEIIYERPCEDATWSPGYYNHYGYRYLWVPGYWRRPVRFHEGWGHERFEHRGFDRDHHGFDRDHHDGGRGGDHHEGRIR